VLECYGCEIFSSAVTNQTVRTFKALRYWARNWANKRKAKFVPVHSKKAHVGSRSMLPLILNFGTSGQLHASSALPPRKKRLNMRLQRGNGGLDVVLPLPGFENQIVQPVSQSCLNSAVPAKIFSHDNNKSETGLL